MISTFSTNKDHPNNGRWHNKKMIRYIFILLISLSFGLAGASSAWSADWTYSNGGSNYAVSGGSGNPATGFQNADNIAVTVDDNGSAEFAAADWETAFAAFNATANTIGEYKITLTDNNGTSGTGALTAAYAVDLSSGGDWEIPGHFKYIQTLEIEVGTTFIDGYAITITLPAGVLIGEVKLPAMTSTNGTITLVTNGTTVGTLTTVADGAVTIDGSSGGLTVLSLGNPSGNSMNSTDWTNADFSVIPTGIQLNGVVNGAIVATGVVGGLNTLDVTFVGNATTTLTDVTALNDVIFNNVVASQTMSSISIGNLTVGAGANLQYEATNTLAINGAINIAAGTTVAPIIPDGKLALVASSANNVINVAGVVTINGELIATTGNATAEVNFAQDVIVNNSITAKNADGSVNFNNDFVVNAGTKVVDMNAGSNIGGDLSIAPIDLGMTFGNVLGNVSVSGKLPVYKKVGTVGTAGTGTDVVFIDATAEDFFSNGFYTAGTNGTVGEIRVEEGTAIKFAGNVGVNGGIKTINITNADVHFTHVNINLYNSLFSIGDNVNAKIDNAATLQGNLQIAAGSELKASNIVTIGGNVANAGTATLTLTTGITGNVNNTSGTLTLDAVTIGGNVTNAVTGTLEFITTATTITGNVTNAGDLTLFSGMSFGSFANNSGTINTLSASSTLTTSGSVSGVADEWKNVTLTVDGPVAPVVAPVTLTLSNTALAALTINGSADVAVTFNCGGDVNITGPITLTPAVDVVITLNCGAFPAAVNATSLSIGTNATVSNKAIVTGELVLDYTTNDAIFPASSSGELNAENLDLTIRSENGGNAHAINVPTLKSLAIELTGTNAEITSANFQPTNITGQFSVYNGIVTGDGLSSIGSFAMDDGSFTSSNNALVINGDAVIAGGTFTVGTMPTADFVTPLTITGNLYITGGIADFSAAGANVNGAISLTGTWGTELIGRTLSPVLDASTTNFAFWNDATTWIVNTDKKTKPTSVDKIELQNAGNILYTSSALPYAPTCWTIACASGVTQPAYLNVTLQGTNTYNPMPTYKGHAPIDCPELQGDPVIANTIEYISYIAQTASASADGKLTVQWNTEYTGSAATFAPKGATGASTPQSVNAWLVVKATNTVAAQLKTNLKGNLPSGNTRRSQTYLNNLIFDGIASTEFEAAYISAAIATTQTHEFVGCTDATEYTIFVIGLNEDGNNYFIEDWSYAAQRGDNPRVITTPAPKKDFNFIVDLNTPQTIYLSAINMEAAGGSPEIATIGAATAEPIGTTDVSKTVNGTYNVSVNAVTGFQSSYYNPAILSTWTGAHAVTLVSSTPYAILDATETVAGTPDNATLGYVIPFANLSIPTPLPAGYHFTATVVGVSAPGVASPAVTGELAYMHTKELDFYTPGSLYSIMYSVDGGTTYIEYGPGIVLGNTVTHIKVHGNFYGEASSPILQYPSSAPTLSLSQAGSGSGSVTSALTGSVTPDGDGKWIYTYALTNYNASTDGANFTITVSNNDYPHIGVFNANVITFNTTEVFAHKIQTPIVTPDYSTNTPAFNFTFTAMNIASADGLIEAANDKAVITNASYTINLVGTPISGTGANINASLVIPNTEQPSDIDASGNYLWGYEKTITSPLIKPGYNYTLTIIGVSSAYPTSVFTVSETFTIPALGIAGGLIVADVDSTLGLPAGQHIYKINGDKPTIYITAPNFANLQGESKIKVGAVTATDLPGAASTDNKIIEATYTIVITGALWDVGVAGLSPATTPQIKSGLIKTKETKVT